MCALVNNVYCVGRNYQLHAAELGNAVPEEPMIFLKPSHAVVPLDGSVLKLPMDRGSLHFEGELVIQLAEDYAPGKTVDELVKRWPLASTSRCVTYSRSLKRRDILGRPQKRLNLPHRLRHPLRFRDREAGGYRFYRKAERRRSTARECEGYDLLPSAYYRLHRRALWPWPR